MLCIGSIRNSRCRKQREQFENRAILYAILSDLRSLLQIKQQFSASLPKKGRGSSSFYRKQNFKTN